MSFKAQMIEYKYVAQMGIKRGFTGWWDGKNGYQTEMDIQMGGGAGMVLGTNPSGRGRGKNYTRREDRDADGYCINRQGWGWEFQSPLRRAPFALLIKTKRAVRVVE